MNERPRLEGKVALITGAGSGIGQASAMLFARHGAAVACVDLEAQTAAASARSIVEAGGRATAIGADVRVWGDVQRMVAQTLETFGDLDVLFNNAGLGVRGKVHEMSEEDWDLVIDTNLKGVFLGSKAAIPHFLERGAGNIINTASTFGILASPRYPGYCASKGGIMMLTKQMALDYGPQIRVNAICPGATNTPRLQRNIARANNPEFERQVNSLNIAMGRLAEPIEIAQAALFLASGESGFCTGSAIVVDGGQTIDA